ncbi:MAG: energy transducer TonB [Spirochaetaceae bacterium]
MGRAVVLSVALLHLVMILTLRLPGGGEEERRVFRLVDLNTRSFEEPPGTGREPPAEAPVQAPPPETAPPAESPGRTENSAARGETAPPVEAPGPTERSAARGETAPPVEAPGPTERSAARGEEAARGAAEAGEGSGFRPEHLVSTPPVIPRDALRRRVDYPLLARRRGTEGVVYLELFIDAEGVVRRAEILSDPGDGLAEAARRAFEDLVVVPAEADGRPVAVRYRYPVRFELQ